MAGKTLLPLLSLPIGNVTHGSILSPTEILVDIWIVEFAAFTYVVTFISKNEQVTPPPG